MRLLDCCQVEFPKDGHAALEDLAAMVTTNTSALFDRNVVLMEYGPEPIGAAEIVENVELRCESTRDRLWRSDLIHWQPPTEEVWLPLEDQL